MRGRIGVVLNDSDIDRALVRRWGIPPGLFLQECGNDWKCWGWRYTDFRSVELIEMIGDAGAYNFDFRSLFPELEWQEGWGELRAANHEG